MANPFNDAIQRPFVSQMVSKEVKLKRAYSNSVTNL